MATNTELIKQQIRFMIYVYNQQMPKDLGLRDKAWAKCKYKLSNVFLTKLSYNEQIESCINDEFMHELFYEYLDQYQRNVLALSL